MTTPKDSKVKPPDPKQLGLHVRGTFFICPNLPGKPCALYVFQGVHPGYGNIPGYPNKDRQIRRWVKPRDPQTVPQMARRMVFREAMAQWHELTSQDKGKWADEANGRHMSGLNAFMSYMLRGGLEA